MLGTLTVRLQPPFAGAQLPPLGFAVVSLPVPSHRRGPLWPELAGSPLASPRPHDSSLHVPDVDNVTCPNREKELLPPKRADFAESMAVASNGVELVTSLLNLSTISGTVNCTGAPAPCPVM